MKSVKWIAGMVVALRLAGTVLVAGCSHFEDDCLRAHDCPAGADGGTPTGCVPSMSTGAVANTCGVFVSPMGDDGNPGTKEMPLKTITAALGKGTAVYVCAGTMPYPEALTVSKTVAVYGALDCTIWVYSAATKTQLASAPDAVPLSLASTAAGTEVHDFLITAADASVPNGSSIAVLDDGADLTLVNVNVAAGAGKEGTAGMTQNRVATLTSASGTNGNGDLTCKMTTAPGGAGGTNTCNGMKTDGGYGGNGVPSAVGAPGGNGQPMTPANGGTGQTQTASCNAMDPKGADGVPGTAGTGARGFGDVSAAGYQPPAATLGGSGAPGEGGGGGGGAATCDPNDTPPMYAGPSGGGGGAGGCGGAAGNLGTSGGSSIGILALGGSLTLTGVSITTHDGGTGGIGAAGQPGQNGGAQGNQGGSGACPGGIGGQGGTGGPGGGGAGGHSVGIALKGGTAPDLSQASVILGSAGMGGSGGDTSPMTKGDDGMACKTLDFTNPTSCAM